MALEPEQMIEELAQAQGTTIPERIEAAEDRWSYLLGRTNEAQRVLGAFNKGLDAGVARAVGYNRGHQTEQPERDISEMSLAERAALE